MNNNDKNKGEVKDVQKLLKSIEKRGVQKKEEVIYGVYDNRNASISTKINDFLIDNSKVSLKEKAYFFHLLAVMVDAGIPVLQALKVLSSKTKNRRFQRIINTLEYSTSRGNTLSDSMARFPDVFTDAEIGVVKAGEAAGNLDKMLFRLSAQTERVNELQIKIYTASVYPIIVISVLIIVAIIMIVGVVPVLTDLLVQGGLDAEDFPFATRLLIGSSDFIANYWWTLVLGIFAIYGIFKVYKATEAGKFQIDFTKLKIPVVGALIRKVLVLRFISMLGILMEAGLPVIKTLQITAHLMNSAPYELKILEVIKKVQAGEKISENLMDAPFLFPETVTQMISIGEKTASIATISEKVASHYDREIDHSIKRLTAIFEPIMILLVALFIVLLALAVLMPIFTFTSTI